MVKKDLAVRLGNKGREESRLSSSAKLKKSLTYMRENWILYLMLLPGVLLTFVFRYIPMYGILIAFQNFSPMRGIWGSEWVGFAHFTRFLTSPNFGMLLNNTLRLSIFGLLVGFPIPIILALMLNQIRRKGAKRNIQLILYAPNFISVVVVVGMIFFLLSPTGPVNSIVEIFTGQPIFFMSRPEYFRTIYIVSGIWQGAGWSSIIYTAALANVDTQLYDAAMLDGASLLQRIRHIELPILKPTMVVLFILSAGGIMSVGFEKAFLMQTSMNIPASEIIPTFIYRVGLVSMDFSFSSAIGLFNTVVNLVLLLLVNFVVKKLNEGEGLI